jgi:fructuronate reductase
MTTRLDLSNYQTARNCELPSYNPAEHACGIAHIGIGAFHKAHQAVFTHDLLNLQGGDWRITAISLRNPTARDQLAPQDGLYTLVEKSDGKINYRLISSVAKVLVAPEDPAAVIALLAQESTKVVTLTITEKGYCQTQGALDIQHPDICADLNNPSAPTSMPGFIVAACAQRRAQQRAGFSVISCDNLPHNGRIARAVVLGFAEQIDSELAAWISANISFCNSMVDRIVPATTAADIAATAEHLGLGDEATVVSEPFRQWVIEDNFCNQRPRWEAVGALIVKDVTPYETMKLRLLNGSHSTLAYLGFLSGYDFIHQAIADPELLALTKKLMDEEVSATLNVPKGFDLESYKQNIRARFSNSLVPYRTTQVANDGSQKLPQRLLLAASELLQIGAYPTTIALIVAAWFRFLEAEDSQGKSMEINDPMAKILTPIARGNRFNESMQVERLIAATGIFPPALKAHPTFIQDIEHWLKVIHQLGAKEAIRSFNNNFVATT